MCVVFLLTAKPETCFQSSVLVICHMNEPRPGCSSDFNQDDLRELMGCNLCKSA